MKHDLSPAIRKYLRRILRSLRLPGSIKQRIYSDLKTSIQAKAEAGMSDQEIIASMGSPNEVAAEFHEQMPDCCYHKHPLRFVCLFISIFSFLALLIKLFLNAFLSWLMNSESSIGIIGGADGPTSIFVATVVRDGISPEYILYPLLILLGLLGYYRFSRRKRKE